MAKKFAELEAKMSPASRSRSDALYEKLVAEMPLHELRQAKALSQVKLAKALHINQAAVSKMENRADMYISTLRDYIRAMGGDLEIVGATQRRHENCQSATKHLASQTKRKENGMNRPPHMASVSHAAVLGQQVHIEIDAA